MTVNETQVLKWAALSVAVVTAVTSGAAWTMLYKLRKAVRRNRAIRAEKERQQNRSTVEHGRLAGVR